MLKKPAGMQKRPASKAGDGEDNPKKLKTGVPSPKEGESWSAFQMVPFIGQKAGGAAGAPGSAGATDNVPNKILNLSIGEAFKKPPALVKHLAGNSTNTPAGSQSVKDALRKLEREGHNGWLETYEGGSMLEKRQIISRLAMCLDNAGLMVKQVETSGQKTSSKEARGWTSIWEIAKMESIPFEPQYQNILADLIKDDPSRPHRNESLREKGWREYYHKKDQGDVEEIYYENKMSAESEETNVSMDPFLDAKKAISMSGGTARPMTKNAPTTSGQVAKWIEECDGLTQRLAEEEGIAKGLGHQLEEKVGGPVVQRKHVRLAETFVSTFESKRDYCIKMKALIGPSSELILTKEKNKFSAVLESAKELLESWTSESNKELLMKVADL